MTPIDDTQEEKQRIFNIVAKHLLTQKKLSIGLDNGCAYRGKDGRKCAAGCLIDDEHYLPEFEGKTIDSTDVTQAIIKSGVNYSEYVHGFIYDLQRHVHDAVYIITSYIPDPEQDFSKEFTERLYKVANDHVLEFDPNTILEA
jgi:hypothetical protein